MKPKNQRLVLVAAALVAVLAAVLLAMWGLQGPGILFLHARRHRRRQGRAGPGRCGSAEWSSRARSSAQRDGVTIRFIVTDGEGAHAGHLSRHRARPVPRRQRRGRRRAACENGTFVADTILAKHDERYMPPELGNLAAEHKAGKTLEQ